MRRGNQDRRLAQAIEAQLDALYRVALRLSGDPPAAEDLVQETCLRAWRGRPSLHNAANLKAWLFRILRNAWIDAARKANREPVVVQLDSESERFDAESALLPPSDVTDRDELERCLDDELLSALDELTDEERLAVLYQSMAEMSYQEIAEAMSCPLGSVMSRLHRARAKLRNCLAARGRHWGIGPHASDTPQPQEPERRHGSA